MLTLEQSKLIEQWVDTVPHTPGWWSESSRETFVRVAEWLIDYGVDFETTKEKLEGLYHAVSAEYGN